MLKSIKTKVLGLCLLCLAYTSITAQEKNPTNESKEKATIVYNIDNLNFFDNREVRSPYQRSQTLYGSRLGAEIGLQFDESAIMVGAVGVKDFGQSGIQHKDLTLYYHYESEHFSGAFGAFPRSQLKRELPDIFIYDSIRYYTPTLHGTLIQYNNSCGYAEFYCNWLNKQGVNEREIFELVTDGQFGKKGYHFGWNAQLTHFSVPRPSNGLFVYDKLMLNPYIGVEMSDLVWADAFRMEAGLMLSLNRDRRDMQWKSPMGFLGEFTIRKWRFSIRDRLYAGNPQFSDYETFGAQLHRGDPYYRSGLYNRTDISFYLLNKSHVQCTVTASFHFTEGSMDNSQLVVLRLYK